MNGVDSMLYIQSTNANDGTMNQTRHVRRRHQHRHRQRAGPEPLLAGAAVPAAGREELRRHHQEVAGVPADGRLAVFARRPLRRRRSSPTTRSSTSTTRSCASRRRRHSQPGRARLRDARLAQARRAGAPGPDRRPTSRTRCARRTSSIRRVRSAPSPRRRASSSRTPCARRGGWSTPEEFGERRSCARTPTARCVRVQGRRAHRARLAQLQAVRHVQRQAGRASSRRSRSPGSNALDVAADHPHRRWTISQKRFPPGMDYEVSLDTTAPVKAGIEEIVDHAARGDRAGRAGGVHLPAELARHAHPAAHRAGVAGRRVRACSRCSASRSTRCRCSGWCWRSAWSSTTPSSWSRRSSTTSRRACRRAMRRLQGDVRGAGPVVAIALILAAVFIPVAFMSGITGRLYQQFALTIADLGADLGVQRADAQPGAERAPAPAARRTRGLPRSRSARRFNRWLRSRHRRLRVA